MKKFFNPISVGSRGSRLARVQVEEIFSLLKKKKIFLPYEVKYYQTQGDKDQITPLTINPADDFFTNTLDESLLKGEVDITIHSAKDVPKVLPEGLSIFALTAAVDDRDAFVGRTKLADLPPGSRVGTSSLVRQKEVVKINPGLQPIDIRGDIESRLNQLKDGKYDGIIVAACALKRLGLDKKIKEILPWEATPLQGQLAIIGRTKDWELKKIFAALDVRRRYGKVTLVGAGPGDPDLITVKGIKALRQADCVFYDYLAHPYLLDYAPQAEMIYVGKRKGMHSLPQAELSRQVKEKVFAGKNVVRLKGGDPLIFGRGAEEIEYLRSYCIDVEVVPGITSATGIPATLGLPLTARGLSSSVAFVSGHGENEEETQGSKDILIPKTDTLVFLMGLTRLEVIVRSLRNAGWPQNTSIVVISKGTMVDEKNIFGTLDNIVTLVNHANLAAPVLIVAGTTVKFWRDHSKQQERVLYLGTNPEKYKALGQILHFPMIEISAASLDRKTAQNLRRDIAKFDIVLLTSRFAVRHFFEFLSKQKLLDKVHGLDFAAIGEDTAFLLQRYGINPCVVAAEETGVGMLKALKKAFALKGKRVLFPRSSIPNPYLEKELTNLGAKVCELVIYKNTKPAKRDLPRDQIHKIVFTSPSTVRNFLEDYGVIPKGWQILSKGPRTQEALKFAGYKSEVLVLE